MNRTRLALFLVALLGCKDEVQTAPPRLDEVLAQGQVRAGQIQDEAALLDGPWKKGRVGDLKIYNDRIAVIIAAPGAGRGFSTYGGGVVDADIIRAPGEPSATAFGEVIVALDFLAQAPDTFEIIDDGSSGREARVRVRGGAEVLPLFDAVLGSLIPERPRVLDWAIDYVLEPGASHLRVEHQLKNVGEVDVELAVIGGFFFGTGARPVLEPGGFSSSSSGGGVTYYGATSGKVSYVYGSPGRDIAIIFGESGLVVSTMGEALGLRAREQKTLVDFLLVGGADLAATRKAWRSLAQLPVGQPVSGTVVDSTGSPISQARVHVSRAEAPRTESAYVTRTSSDDVGRFELSLEPGRYEVRAATDDRRVSDPVSFDVAEDPVPGLALAVPATGTLRYELRDSAGALLPTKLSIERLDAPLVRLPGAFGEPDNGGGLYTLEQSATGQGDVALPAGDYRVSASRGGEYEVAVETLVIAAGGTAPFSAELVRSVDTDGWMSSDTHIHARLSPDSNDSDELKVKAMVVENIELPVSTDHDAIGDFNPAIRRFGLEGFMHGIVGTEITTTRYGHFNAFPVLQDGARPFNGRIDWYGKDPAGFFLAAHQAPGEPVVQVNHPRSTTIGYFHHMGLDRDAFEATSPEMSFDFDGIEVLNTCGDSADKRRPELLDWFAFLNRGRRVFATASLDDHTGGRGEMGYPLTYVRTNAAAPGAVTDAEFREAFRAGRLVMSCGPFLTLRLGAADIGDTVRVDDGRIEVNATVRAPSWMDVDEVELIVNGVFRARTTLGVPSATIRFSGTLSATITPGQDAWVALWASGDTPHGIWAQHRPSFAVTNPIFIDGDGDGRWGAPPR